MEMMNRLIGDALDSQKFVDAMKAQELQSQQQMMKTMQADGHTTIYGGGENRTQRRARERAEAKTARKAKA